VAVFGINLYRLKSAGFSPPLIIRMHPYAQPPLDVKGKMNRLGMPARPTALDLVRESL
jgi:hypothetical protein